MLKTEILKIKGDWEEVVNDCRSTVGKGELGKEPSKSFKEKILLAEHSPIRDIIVKWRWKNIKSWISVHWSRHKWECFIRSQRTDRTGIDRNKLPQDAPVDFIGSANCQHLIDTFRKRLCYQADHETRYYAEDFKCSLRPVEKEISDVLVPNCVYRGGCPELSPCGLWDRFVHWCESKKHVDVRTLSLQERYKLYNEYYYSTCS